MKHCKIIFFLIALLLGATGLGYAQHVGDNPGDLPDNVDSVGCIIPLEPHDFDIKIKWQSARSNTEYDVSGVSTPLVADLDGDGNPEVIGVWGSTLPLEDDTKPPRISSYITHDLVVFDGKTGAFKYKIKTIDYQVMGQPIAIADVDGDGKCEIFIVAIGNIIGDSKYDGQFVYCYDGSRANTSASVFKWKSTQSLGRVFTPLVADLNNDGVPELVCGGTIFNAQTGTVILNGTMDPNGMGFADPHMLVGEWNMTKTNHGEPYYMCAVADIDGDHHLEICAGNKVYKPIITNSSDTLGNSWNVLSTAEAILPYSDIYDGETFVLDFDNDGDLDVCVIACRKDHYTQYIFWDAIEDPNHNPPENHIGLYVWDGQTSKMIGYYMCDPKTCALSIPFAADIDGDGASEIIANGWNYGYHWRKNASYADMMHVWKYKADTSANSTIKLRNIKEVFSRAKATPFAESAGFTVFDFNQDGKSEIVFRGEKELHIVDGSTLNPLCTPMTVLSTTVAEYPVVADVDGDGHADIIITDQFGPVSSVGAAGKITVFESATPEVWASARKVWNQWPYNVVNINEDMSVPKYQFDISTEFPNGFKPFNAFLKQQTKLDKNGNKSVLATDANVLSDTSALKVHCDSITIDVDFNNIGDEALYAPYGITIYKDQYKSGDVIYQKTFDEDLEIDDVKHLHLKFKEEDLMQWMPITNFVVAINDIGTGIAEEGNQQRECDTTNNKLTIPFKDFLHTQYDTIVHKMCVGDSYQQNGFSLTNLSTGVYFDTLHLSASNGCDSVLCLELYVYPQPELELNYFPDTVICKGDTVKLCATATALWNRYPVHLGDILCSDSTILHAEDFAQSGKIAIAVVFYVDRSGFHGSAISLKENPQTVQWSTETTTPSDWSYCSLDKVLYDLDGLEHTKRMIALGGEDKFPVLSGIDVAHGWYLPAYGQMRMLYANYGEVLHTMSLLSGNGIETDQFSGYYWSSTQCSNSMACIIQMRGQVLELILSGKRKYRAVIDF